MKDKAFFSGFMFQCLTVFLLVFQAVLFSSCEKLFNWDYNEVKEEIPVVEAVITNELQEQSVRLSLVRSDPNSLFIPLIGAQVIVSVGNTDYSFSESIQQPGLYISDQPFQGIIGEEIRCSVVYNEKIYDASDRMIQVSPSNRGLFLQAGSDSTRYYFQESGSAMYTNEPAMWEFQIYWDFLPAYAGVDPDSCRARIYYYDLKVLDQGQIFSPQQQNQYFPQGAVVYQTKYALSEEHRKFRRSLLLETEWRGGLMDVSPGTVYTNFSNGGLGFFGASAVVRDTFLIQ